MEKYVNNYTFYIQCHVIKWGTRQFNPSLTGSQQHLLTNSERFLVHPMQGVKSL